jgi:histidinol dehydrogenase
MTAGPTELIVIADDSADASLVIADLLAQAEHGYDSTVILVTTSETLAAQMPERALTFLATSLDEAVAITNRLAPEHCSVQTRDPDRIAERVENCGAVFCGPSSPVAAGDYVAGPNHVLPTGGTARFFSPLGVYDFVKRSNVITLDTTTLAAIGPHGETLARLEGLPAHAESIVARRLSCVPS